MRGSGAPWRDHAHQCAGVRRRDCCVGIIGGSLLAGRLDFGWLGLWALLLVSMAAVRATAWLGTRRHRLRAHAEGPAAAPRRCAWTLISSAAAAQDICWRGRWDRRRLGKSLCHGRRADGLGRRRRTRAGAGPCRAAPGGASCWSACSPCGPALGIGLGAVYLRRMIAWTTDRLSLTHRLVERMIGHHTILVQNHRRGARRSIPSSAYHTARSGWTGARCQ